MASQTITTTFNTDEFTGILENLISLTIKKEFAQLKLSDKPQKEILTRDEAAKLLNISLPTLHYHTKSGVVKAHRLGSRVIYHYDDLLQALTQIKAGRN